MELIFRIKLKLIAKISIPILGQIPRINEVVVLNDIGYTIENVAHVYKDGKLEYVYIYLKSPNVYPNVISAIKENN